MSEKNQELETKLFEVVKQQIVNINEACDHGIEFIAADESDVYKFFIKFPTRNVGFFEEIDAVTFLAGYGEAILATKD